ncbi:hypothetical protein GO611_23890, partial [Azoarcus communis SWub3 = DSM 12120]|nr:hypothetical protein [Parazoarcus communis SWub3 = DSM 12120]
MFRLGPGKLTRFARDAMGRLLERRAEADPTCTSRFSYDKLGRLTAAH